MDRTTQFRLAIVVGLAFYFLAISMIVAGALLPEWMETFQVPASRAGRLFFMYYLTYVITTILSGFLCDKVGKKPVLVMSQLFLAGGFLLVASARSFSFLEWGMLTMGVGGGFCEAPLTSLLSQIFSGDEGYALNLSQISFGLGATTGPFLSGFLVGHDFSWRVMYLIPGLVSFCLAYLLGKENHFFSTAATDPDDGKRSFADLWRKWGRFLILSFLAMIFYVGAEIGSSSWMSTYLVKELGSNIYWGGVAMAAFWGMVTLGRFLFAFLSRRFYYRSLLAFSAGLSLFFLVILLFTTRVEVAILAFGGIGLGYSAIWPLIVAVVARRVGSYQATAIGMVVAAGGMGALVFPYLMGVVGDLWGLSSIFLVVTCLVVAQLLVFIQTSFGREEI